MTGSERAGAVRSAVAGQQPPRVEIIGHRGSPREAPENTLASFQHALAQGVDGIELDVHATIDGVVVVHHDPNMDRAQDSAVAGRAIAEVTWGEIAASRSDDRSPAPMLADVLALIGDKAMTYVEIKGARIESAVIACIEQSRAQCAIHAFDHRTAARVRTLAPGIRTGVLIEARLVDPVAAMRDAGATDFWQQWKMIDEDLVAAIHGAGGRVMAWTVNDPDVAARLAGMGVDGLCTDVPGEMRVLFPAEA